MLLDSLRRGPIRTQDQQGLEIKRKDRNHCPQELCIPQLVSAQACLTPNALAVAHGSATLTYQELDDRATRVACSLRALGVGPDVVVGIYLNRSLAMVVGALAVLKAGGAYLPLDPSYPAERLAFVMKDAQASILVTGDCLAEKLPFRSHNVVTLDADGRSKNCQNVDLMVFQATTKNLAYVIYTSGSTGQPKGVEITHASLLNLVSWHQRAFEVSKFDRASELSSLGFDAAVWEVWPYLTAGASVHLPSGLALNDPGAVRDWLVTQRITIGFLPTPLAERAIALEWPNDAALRIMLTGADTLHHYPSSKLPFRLVNNYGPTECTVVATSGTVLPNEHPDQLPSIGRPIANVQIYIVDEKMQPCPIGEPGEIYIGGAGLAQGYRNRPDLTAEKFVRNPFSSDPGSRLYRTGDLARYLQDGEIAFLGRADDQIKVRGFRIEPAEITRVLDEHPAVQASIVVASEVGPGDKRLVAYFVPASKTHPTHTDLRNFIAAHLPEYMIPATFVTLDALPLNPSGKVNRAALPEPDATNTVRDQVILAPRNPIEQRVSGLLTQLLGLGQVSMDDNFFLLGGHSLLGTQLIGRIRKEFGVELSLLTLFDRPTVAQLSSEIEALLVAKLESMSEDEANRTLEAITIVERTYNATD